MQAGSLSTLAFPLPALPLCPQAAMVLVFMFSASWRLTVVTFGEQGHAQLGRLGSMCGRMSQFAAQARLLCPLLAQLSTPAVLCFLQ